MTATIGTLLCTSLALASAGCQDKSTTQEPAHSDVAPRTHARRAPPPASAPIAKATGRNVQKLEACQIVTGADVARITGGKLVSPSNTQGPLCGYVLEKDDETISYRLTFWDPRPFEAMFDAAPAAQLGEKVDGSWSIGYLDKGISPGTYVLSAVWRGDVAMEVQGDSKEQVRQLAELAASRLPAR